MSKTYDNIKVPLIVDQILAFDSSLNTEREVKNLSPNFKRIGATCFTLVTILTRIIRPIFIAKL